MKSAIESEHSVLGLPAASLKKYVCIHGHFYQPPRENPWLETIELQDSAYPYHDWNERICAECFAPNAACRILDKHDQIVKIVNNYSRMSFNFGPTLLSWLQEHAPEVYQAILDADRESAANFSGHGSALAQAYNHAILPLANRRQKELQTVWGIRDFEKRFGRRPEGMWLPETAVDLATLEVLAEHGILFTILAPHQARRVRKLGTKEWKEVPKGVIETTRPYQLNLPSGATIALFFYDGPVSRAVAFENLLNNGEDFARRLVNGFLNNHHDLEEPQLAHIATDGETYGHHHRFGDMALAFALDYLEQNELAQLTNYGEFLELHPPRWEVEIVEDSSWSCIHGIERWRSDCGCNSGSRPSWHQGWRGPLRQSLEWLEAEVDAVFEREAARWLTDSRAALHDYVDVILDRSSPSLDDFLDRHGSQTLSRGEQIGVLKLLEMQRFAALMFTSCAWFFDEISGLETSQILQYAGRVIQLASEAGGADLEPEFMEKLEDAASNLPEHGDGRRIYQKWVRPAKVDLLKVGAHFALSSLFESYGESNSIFCYSVEALEARTFRVGQACAAVGQARITSWITLEADTFTFASVHLGDHNVTGGVRASQTPDALQELSQALEQRIARVDLAGAVRLLDRHFGDHHYSLDSLFRDEQRKILKIILDSAVSDLEDSIQGLYRQKIPLMRYLESLNLPLPPALALTAQFALNTRLRNLLREEDFPLSQVQEVFKEAEARRVSWDAGGVGYNLEHRVEAMARQALESPGDLVQLEKLEATIDLLLRVPFKVDLWKTQNLFWKALQRELHRGGNDAWRESFWRLGRKLRVKIEDRDLTSPASANS